MTAITKKAQSSGTLRGGGFFVTGTDTGVGKTLATCALLLLYRRRGLRAAAMKPVAAGVAKGENINADVSALIKAANVKAPLALVNPYSFIPPIAPHIAAARAGEKIDLDTIAAAYSQLQARADAVIVEGVGGFAVPLSAAKKTDGADFLCARLGLPIVLVVGMRLGCLNHALLTIAAIRARRLPIAGWLACHTSPRMTAAADNLAFLRARFGDAAFLGAIPYLGKNATSQAAAKYLRLPEY